MATDRTVRRATDSPDDRLEADERGVEWHAAMLKARRSPRHAQLLRRALWGDAEGLSDREAARGPAHASAPTREQESLFECLRASAGLLGGAWLCTIEGAGRQMRVSLAEPASTRIAWRHTGSPKEVLVAFGDWLARRPAPRE